MKNKHDPFRIEEHFKQRDESARLLGICCMQFQQMEGELAKAVGFLCTPDDWEAGQIIAAELSFRGLCNLASSMFRHWKRPKDKVEEWDRLISRCLKQESRRNELTHSTYGTTGFGDDPIIFQRTKVTAKFRKGRRENCEALLNQDLVDFARECDSIYINIHETLCSNFPGWHDGSWAAKHIHQSQPRD